MISLSEGGLASQAGAKLQVEAGRGGKRGRRGGRERGRRRSRRGGGEAVRDRRGTGFLSLTLLTHYAKVSCNVMHSLNAAAKVCTM